MVWSQVVFWDENNSQYSQRQNFRMTAVASLSTDRSAERLPPLVDVCEGLLEGRGRARRLGEPRGCRAHRAPPAAVVPVVTAAAVGEVGRAVGRDRVVRRGQNWST